MTVRIAPDKDSDVALLDSEERNDRARTKIYSDGSGLEGRIGAAAVMFKSQPGAEMESQASLLKYLGSEDEQTVYVAAQAGELMSLELLWKAEQGTVDWTSIFVDSQASLRALSSNKPGSGHQLADAVYDAYYSRVMEKHPQARITFRWVAAHKDCSCNEEVDRLVNQASSGTHDSPLEELPQMLRRTLP